MKYKIVPNIIAILFAVIIGVALFKQIDFQNMTVEKPVLALVYLIGFLVSIGFMIKKSKNNYLLLRVYCCGNSCRNLNYT